jgi:hypothetical protein
MNKLESEIYQWLDGVDKYDYALTSEKEYVAKEIAKIALEIAEKAHYNGWDKSAFYGYHGTPDPSVQEKVSFEQFKQEIL